MNHVAEQIKARRSVRTFDSQPLAESTRQKLASFWQTIKNPFDIPVTFRFLDGKTHGLVCPVVSGTELYVGGKVSDVPNASVAFGYSFEVFVLQAQSLGMGTVWLGGTMNRAAFEKAMELAEDEMMPCASPVGYAAQKMSVRETVMRKGVKADERMPFEALFSQGCPDVPLSKENAGALLLPLEMVRLAPSAVNKQPWRGVVTRDAVHFYLKRSKGFGHEGRLDMQKIDMGIALCHFALTAEECGLKIAFLQKEPEDIQAGDMEYIASYCLL